MNVCCQESYEAGIAYGKQYRRSHCSWSSDAAVARRAADTLAGVRQDRYDHASFYHGVVQGLRPFAAADFEETFERNRQLATYRAQAIHDGMRLQIATQDATHYASTLAYWRLIGAQSIEERRYVE